MDLKTEIKIEEEDLELQFTSSYEDTQIPLEPGICPEIQAKEKVNQVTKPETVSNDIESSDFIEGYGNSEKDSWNDDHLRKVAKSSIKERSEYLDDFKKLECTLSNANFEDKIKLKNDLTLHKKRKIFKCPETECSFECDQKINLKRHIFIHTKIKLFKCSECNYTCNQNTNLKSHMLIHRGDKLFKCSECSYSCNQKANFTVHMLNHRDIKLFKCDECDYGCNRKDYLAKHVLKHTKTKFKCPTCHFECEDKLYLRSHMFTHAKTKLLKCSECRYECRFKANLKRHSLRHVKKSEEEWFWSYKDNEYLMECYYVGEAILEKTEKTGLWNNVKEKEINSNDFMEYLFNLKYNLDRRTLVKQKHRIIFNVIKERQESKKKINLLAEEDLERIKAKAKQLVENEFEPSMKMIRKIKQNVERLHRKNKKGF